MLVAFAITSWIRRSPSSTIIWNEREYRKSPTSTLASLPKTWLAVSRPRRMSEPSTTSSWSRVAVWMNSMIAAADTCFWPLVAAGARGQHDAQRPQPLAAATDDVLRDLVDQDDVAGQPLDDGLVDALQVVHDQRPDLFELHSRDKPPGCRFLGNPAWYLSFPG